MTGCAGSREMCSCLVMLPDACQNLHSWNVNDAERELQAIRSAAGHGCTRGGHALAHAESHHKRVCLYQ